MITVTTLAVTKIKEISEAEGFGHTKFRIKVIGGGCSGFQYDMEFLASPEAINELDEVVEQDGVTVVVDPVSFQYLSNVNIDYVEGLIGTGFKFNNPDAKGSCGCQKSFDF
jgi:iron-sulfur cluster insertion protein